MATVQGSMIVITGPPGAGKSTVSRIVADSFETSVLLIGDEFHHFIRRGYVSPWLPESERQNEVVIDSTAAAAVSYAMGGYLVVVDGIIGHWFLERWLAHVPDELPVSYIILRPSKDVAVRRATERAGERDLISSGPVVLMHDVFTERGGFDDHVLDSSEMTAEATATAILKLVDEGRLLLRR